VSDLHLALQALSSLLLAFTGVIPVDLLTITIFFAPTSLRTQTNTERRFQGVYTDKRQVYYKKGHGDKATAFSLRVRIRFRSCFWRPWSAPRTTRGMRKGQDFV
jgi:hypothetical protein